MGHRCMNRLVSRFDFKLIDNKRGLDIRVLFKYDSKFEFKRKKQFMFFF